MPFAEAVIPRAETLTHGKKKLMAPTALLMAMMMLLIEIEEDVLGLAVICDCDIGATGVAGVGWAGIVLGATLSADASGGVGGFGAIGDSGIGG